MSEEFTEDQQLVITKEEEFFTINSPFGKLLFHAYSEKDQNLEKHYQMFKKAE